MDELIDKIREGDRRSLARAMTLVDRPGSVARSGSVVRSGAAANSLEDRLRRLTKHVPWWGITGPPGVGKSSLIDRLIGMLRERRRRVGVVAIDPTSPFTSGALLGDRIRMMRHALDLDVFIRSLATHGREGGLSDAALHCSRLLELADFDPVLIETVGVGQNEVDVASVVDICVVVLGPGHGDQIQLIKAGLLEIADVVVVNKCDTPEADRVLKEVREELGATGCSRQVEIAGVSAKSGEGVDELLAHLLELDGGARGGEQATRRAHRRLLGEISRGALRAFEHGLERELARPEMKELIDGIQSGELAMDSVLARLAESVITNRT